MPENTAKKQKNPQNPPKKTLRSIFQRYMIRPTVYKAFSRFILALTASLLWDHFVNTGMLNMRAWAFTFFGVFFLVAAWLAYLRLDGVKMPKINVPKLNKKPMRTYGDMIDHTDEELISFEDLEPDERDLCVLIADAVLGVVFLALSLI